jgi:hypothetical protein
MLGVGGTGVGEGSGTSSTTGGVASV